MAHTSARSAFASIIVVVSLVVTLGLSAAGCGVAPAEGPTDTSAPSGPASLSSSVAATQSPATSESRTITSVTELVEPPLSGSTTPLGRLIRGDLSLAGIQVLEASGGPGMTGKPVPVVIKVLGAKGQEPSAFAALADEVFALALPYKQSLYFESLQVWVTTMSGEVLYDHTYLVDPPESTTSTTQPFITYYSGPALDVKPREGVHLGASVSRASDGATIVVSITMENNSATPFTFSWEDVRFYVGGVRLDPIPDPWMTGARPPVEPGGTDGAGLWFSVPGFDPHAAGLEYVSSDAGSAGFTASDGQVPLN